MAETKPPVEVELTWDGELRFTGRSGEATIVLDSPGRFGPSPMQALGFALAGCMAMDLVHILRKGHHQPDAVRAALRGERAAEEPRRFVRVTLHFIVSGNAPRDQVERALALSREKYCSVWHSMRQDIEFTVTYEIESSSPSSH